MKNIIRKVTRSLGFDIVRYFPVPIDQAKAINPQQKGADFLKMLTYKQIDLVLDIGANKGQFASGLLEIGYRGNIVSFEPLSSAYEQLLESRKPYPQWSVFDRCAVGDAEGEIEINISQNSESSSVLPMLQAHLDAAPRSAYVDVEKAPIHRLDAIAEPLVKKAQHTLLKIDTQGYEAQVIAGASGLLKDIDGIHVELSLVPLYEGQPTFEFMLHKLQSLGFSLYSLSKGFKDYRTGRVLQIDGTFFKD